MKNLSNRNKYVDILWKPVLFISLYVIVTLTLGGQLIYSRNLTHLVDLGSVLLFLFTPVYLVLGFYSGKRAALYFKASRTELAVYGLCYSMYPVLLLIMEASLRDNLGAIAFGNNIFTLPAIVLLGIASFVIGGALAASSVKKRTKKK